MTNTESAALMRDMEFQGRVKVACLRFADFIMSEPQVTPAHNTRAKWATMTMQAPDSVAQSIQQPVVMDAQVQADGAAITDEALQSSVEATVNKLL